MEAYNKGSGGNADKPGPSTCNYLHFLEEDVDDPAIPVFHMD